MRGRGIIRACICMITVMMLSAGGCSKADEGRKSMAGNESGRGSETSEILYASDDTSDGAEGYQKLLARYPDLQEGKTLDLEYDFDCTEYQTLLETYHLEEIAGEGSEFERAVRLMDCFAPRLTHRSDYDNHIEDNALALLKYSLDNKNQGINCRAKTKILNEMCLALGIYCRRVWLMPYSSLDQDCHVVTEIYDQSYQKWILLDMTSDLYFVNEEGIPLSVLELRDCGVKDLQFTPMKTEYKGGYKRALKHNYLPDVKAYFLKNLFYIDVQRYNGAGDGPEDTEFSYYLVPNGYDAWKRDCAHDKNLLQSAKEYGLTEKEIKRLQESVKYYEENESTYQIVSPEVMMRKPE